MNFKAIAPLSFFAVLFCLGCASEPPAPPPPPPPTLVELNIVSDKTSNPDANNQASPVLLRIYELKDKSNFANADFFAVFNKEQATLAGDLLHKQEMFFKPDDKAELKIEPDPQTKLIGVFAAFRNLDNAQWRAMGVLNPHKTNVLQLNISGNALKLTEIQKEDKKDDKEAKPD